MAEQPPVRAVLAEFADPDPLLAAVRTLRGRGWQVELFTPFPLEGMAAALGWRDRRVPLAFLIGGTLGALGGFAMQALISLDFVLDVGGRPVIAVPAFMLITFELLVLFAVFGGIGTMLAANRLPRLHHPLFDAPRFGLASDDRFFLAVMPGADGPAPDEARAVLWRLGAAEVNDICESGLS